MKLCLILLVIIGLLAVGALTTRAWQRVNTTAETTAETVSPPPVPGAVVRMTDHGFEPATLTMGRWSTVLFLNESAVDHWPASNIHPTHFVYPEFDPRKPILSGGQWTFTFTRAGIWRYHDHLFPEFVAVITVE